MNAQNSDKKSEALYAFLKGEKNYDPADLPAEEAALGAALQQSAREIRPDPRFKADLERRLLAAAQSGEGEQGLSATPPRSLGSFLRSLSGLGRSLSYAALAGALVLGLSWAFRSLVPRQPVTGGSPAETAALSSASTPAPPGVRTTLEGVPGEVPAGTPSGAAQGPAGLPALSVAVDFPQGPAEALVYQQESGRPVTSEEARTVAAQLGIDGQLYQYPSETGDTNILVSDGWAQVLFMGTIDHFSYTADVTKILEDRWDGLPFEQQAAIAEEWLVGHGLIDDPTAYQAEPLTPWPNTVRFVPLLDGRPVRYGAFEAPQIDVELNPEGSVVNVTYQRLRVQSAQNLPVISAAEAWERAQAYREGQGVQLSARDTQPYKLQSWLREYPLGERVDLWDYVSWLVPLDAGAQPLAFVRNHPLAGDLQAFIAQADLGQFYHVWGQFREVEPGRRVFEMEGWEPAPENGGEGQRSEQYGSLAGTVHREGGRAYFETEAGQQLELPGLPADVPDGTQGTVWGKPLEGAEATLDWHILQSGGLEERLDARSGMIGNITLEPGSVETAPAESDGFEVGQRVEGLEGGITVQYWEDDSGERATEVQFVADPSDGFPNGLAARLVGPGLSGIEEAHWAVVRLWGTVTGASQGVAEVEVERWELVTPAPEVLAWMGTWEAVTLEGKEVVLFTAQDGQQYVIGSSIDFGLQGMVGRPGDQVIVEGTLKPEGTFGGYPVIEMMGAEMAGRITDLKNYEIHSNKPSVLYKEKTGWEALPGGEITIDQVELVYLGFDQSHGSLPGPGSPPLYLQPVWRFTGQYETGEEVEILVQAVPEAYRVQ